MQFLCQIGHWCYAENSKEFVLKRAVGALVAAQKK